MFSNAITHQLASRLPPRCVLRGGLVALGPELEHDALVERSGGPLVVGGHPNAMPTGPEVHENRRAPVDSGVLDT